jgi:hypothetical protein
VTVLEDRLRSELRAESELITPESIVPLRLPGDAEHVPGVPRRRGSRQWPPWAIPLAAAAAAAAVIAGTFAVAHMLPGSGPRPRPAGPKYATIPANYAYTVQGDIYNYTSHGTQYGASVTGRYLKVRSTATGKLLATVRPPRPYNNFSMITADAGGTVFVLGAAHNWQRYANAGPQVYFLNQTTLMRFLELRIGPAGQVQQSSLSLPVKVSPGQQPSIALSPEGSRLAVAFGGGGAPAEVAVVSLGSGRVRRWVSPRVSWTPQLNYRGAWTADGRTLALQEWPVLRSSSRRALNQYHPPATTSVHLIDTLAPGGTMAAGRLLVLRPPAGESAPSNVFITPDGTKLIGSTGKSDFAPVRGTWTGELSVYSARTGALLQRLAPWKWNGLDLRPAHGGFPRELIAWSSLSGSRLILLHPVADLNVLGVLTGRRFSPAGALLPQAAGYQKLEYALRTASQMAW